jgi:hypothetical protein
MSKHPLACIVSGSLVAAASVGLTTQATIRNRDFAVHARFDLTTPAGAPSPAIASQTSMQGI